jgi:hypothetical protein
MSHENGWNTLTAGLFQWSCSNLSVLLSDIVGEFAETIHEFEERGSLFMSGTVDSMKESNSLRHVVMKCLFISTTFQMLVHMSSNYPIPRIQFGCK